jgi:hypothetical protein
MEHLRSVRSLEISCERAERLLPHFFDRHRNGEGSVVIHFHVPFHDVPLIVRIDRRLDDTYLNEIYAVDWTPKHPGLFAEFRGRVIACTRADDEGACLELDGEYEPPYGHVVGQALDKTVSHALIQRTADAFLNHIADGLHELHQLNPASA